MSEFTEHPNLTVEPWATVAANCHMGTSPFRMGLEAEKLGVPGCPYTKPGTIRLFEEGREAYRDFVSQG